VKYKPIVASLFGALCLYVQSSWPAEADSIVFYPAITSGGTAIVEGRVTQQRNSKPAASTDRKRDNLRRSTSLMINNERKHYPITVKFGSREWRTKTDQEGYFRIEVERSEELATGWHELTGETAHGRGIGQLLRLPSENTSGLISDIDDTIQVTEVNSKRRMLANTFLHNETQRQVVPGVVNFYRHLAQQNPHPDLAPIIYLSASPRQLHTVIDSFLALNKFPHGVLITKRVTNDRSSEPIIDQVAYKTQKIETLLKRLPLIRFTLVGDDGESDPEIYADIQRRFPNRVTAIWIREVNPDTKRPRIAGQGSLNSALQEFVHD
jgi:phosphatidate phosphatase APP1